MASACGLTQERNETPEATPQWRALQRSRLAEVSAKIRDCQALLECLHAEREELENTIHSFTYPVLTTPVEIVSHIFLDCLPAHGRVQPSQRAAPLALAQIYQHWREIAHSLHQLWSSIDLNFPPNSPDFDACALLRTWFRRANGHPLSITLRCDGEHDIHVLHSLPPTILPTIAEFSAQWGRLEICLPSRDLPAFARIRGPFPMLQRLAVEMSDGWPTDEYRPAYWDSPNLRDVSVPRGPKLADLQSVPPQPRSGLTSRGSPWQYRTGSALSSSAPVLENIPPLESLVLLRSRDPLPILTLPRLRRLQYSPTSSPIFLSFLSRSRCVLQQLTVNLYSVDEESFMACLRTVPSLVRLDVFRHQKGQSFYEYLQSPTLLPQFRELSVFLVHMPSLSDGITDLLRARRVSHPARVQLCSFDLGHDVAVTVPDKILASLQRLVADGLQSRVYAGSRFWPDGPPRDDERRFP
ncbi:hypothetical protein DFH09DRAFT_1487163 [Mycena vulgaris]|nr:hypothetical protein DFH09DRAFT_1487163 [Mycena vulgaris]